MFDDTDSVYVSLFPLFLSFLLCKKCHCEDEHQRVGKVNAYGMDVKAELSPPRRKHTDSYNFSVLAKQEARDGIAKDISDLLTTCPPGKQEEFSSNLDSFKEIFSRFVDEDEKKLAWSELQAPPDDVVRSYADLAAPGAELKEMLDKLVVLKLNGELQIGGTGPKSLITVRDGSTFLDMQVQQIEHLNDKYGCSIPLVFMNSIKTHGHEDLQKVLRKYARVNVSLFTFQQSIYPRIYKESLRSVPRSVEEGVIRSRKEGSIEMWYSPGHGDFYQSFYKSGLLQKFIDDGKEYIFVSNIDNLGATVDLSILNQLLSQPEDARCEFLMEVTDRTRTDVKGGSIIKYNNKVRLLETGQVPKEHAEEFKSSAKFRFFNTNNIWIELAAIKRAMESNSLHMEVIAHHMQLEDGNKVIQLQTAVGAAIRHFDRHLCVNVPRCRFLPVKSCSDLFLILSNLYHVRNGTMSMSSQRQFPTPPVVKLGKYFDKIGDFLSRFDSIPNILDLDHLTVAGDVTFGKNVVLKGTVIIIANHGERIDIPPGAVLENKIVSGNLRLIDH